MVQRSPKHLVVSGFFNIIVNISDFVYLLVWIIVTIYSDSVLCLRHRQRSIERAMDLTDRFTWEDLPTRDADTGHLTAAGLVPLIKTYTRRAAVLITVFHTVQSSVHITTKHETMYTVWYPFDWNVSPFYELVNILQVTISINIRR
jgi:hypothetical protein